MRNPFDFDGECDTGSGRTGLELGPISMSAAENCCCINPNAKKQQQPNHKRRKSGKVLT